MANNLKDTADAAAAGEGHNKGPLSDEDKQDLILKLEEELAPLEAEKDMINKKIIKLHRNFKTKTGITKKDFMEGRRFAMIEDEDEQEEKTKNFNLVYRTLASNGQMDLFGEND